MDKTFRAFILATGLLGAGPAFLFMVLGPLISNGVSADVIVAALGYPALLLVSGIVGLLSFRGAFGAALLAPGCVTYVFALAFAAENQTVDSEMLAFLAIIAAPALFQILLTSTAIGLRFYRGRMSRF